MKEYKYYSVIVLLIKDENRYLKEWLDWHFTLGFSHVYIYDNGTMEHVDEVTDSYPLEKITVIDWRGHHVHIQQDAYNHFLSLFRQEVRWAITLDSDEFMRFTNGQTDINVFLQNYERYIEVCGYFVEYGAGGQEHYKDKPVRERFTCPVFVNEGKYWKNFVQINEIKCFIAHFAYYQGCEQRRYLNESQNRNLFEIDHYYTKSWEEWQWKIKERGSCDVDFRKSLREFFLYNPDMAYLNTGENVVQAYE